MANTDRDERRQGAPPLVPSDINDFGQQHTGAARHDRAAVVTEAILQIVRAALLARLRGERATVADVHTEIEDVLRGEFADVVRETMNENSSRRRVSRRCSLAGK